MSSPNPFNPAEPGVAESEWRSLLERAPRWSPPVGDIVVVSPHPDDEVLGAGGLIRSCATAGRRVTVVSVTDGEAADPTRADLASVRSRELRRALGILSAGRSRIVRLAIPDGCVSAHHHSLEDALIDCIRPGITLIAPYEGDAHPDHVAVAEVSLRVARSADVGIARYPIWAWHHTSPDKLKRARWGLFRLSAEARRAKELGIQCFESQLRPPRGEPILPPHVVSHFRRPFEAFLL